MRLFLMDATAAAESPSGMGDAAVARRGQRASRLLFAHLVLIVFSIPTHVFCDSARRFYHPYPPLPRRTFTRKRSTRNGRE